MNTKFSSSSYPTSLNPTKWSEIGKGVLATNATALLRTIILLALTLPSPFLGGIGGEVGWGQMVTDTFSFTGSQQTFIVPSDVNTIFIDAQEQIPI